MDLLDVHEQEYSTRALGSWPTCAKPFVHRDGSSTLCRALPALKSLLTLSLSLHQLTCVTRPWARNTDSTTLYQVPGTRYQVPGKHHHVLISSCSCSVKPPFGPLSFSLAVSCPPTSTDGARIVAGTVNIGRQGLAWWGNICRTLSPLTVHAWFMHVHILATKQPQHRHVGER